MTPENKAIFDPPAIGHNRHTADGHGPFGDTLVVGVGRQK